MNAAWMSSLFGITIRDMLRKRHVPGANSRHVAAAMRWLCQAQDACGDGGVSAGYDLLWNKWLPSYPEVTGYIIPTFFDYAQYSGDSGLRERAIRMAGWESAIQLECGAVMSGNCGTEKRIPTVFDTGQVIFGWIRAYEETQQETFIHSAEKAAEWLCDVQDEDGVWRKYPALQVKNKLNVYNARVAWALINAYSVLKKERYIDAARRNIEWAIRQQNENGWFAYNDFDCNKSPLTHTIAYAAEGILEAGIYFQKDEYVNSVAKCCNALIHQISKDGLLSGRYDCNWNPRATWSCLAGDAQISIVLSKLFELTHIEEYHEVARNINNALKGIQGMCFANRNIDGGITGSWPIFGGYESYKYVSWAAKFFVDALLLEKS